MKAPEVEERIETVLPGTSLLEVSRVGVAEEITDPDEIRAAKAMGLRPFAAGDRTHVVKIRPEFLSGRRIA